MDTHNRANSRVVVSGQRLWSDLGGGPFLRPISVRVCDQLKPAHSQSAERTIGSSEPR
jgi:hypothetical protein